MGDNTIRPKTSMDKAEIKRFQEMFRAGMEQYELKPGDLADHRHLRGGTGRRLARLNDSRAILCLCKGTGEEQKQSVRKLYEHAMESAGNRPVSPEWAYAMLCLLHATKKVRLWRESRDMGEDDWLWEMVNPSRMPAAEDALRRRDPWREPDPYTSGEGLPPIGIPSKYASKRFAREIARVLAKTKNLAGQPWIRRVDEDDVAVLLDLWFASNRVEFAASFASWFALASQYRVVIDDSKRETTRIVVRNGRKAETHEVPTHGDPREIHRIFYQWDGPPGDREPRPEEIVYGLLIYDDLDEQARQNHRAQTGAKRVQSGAPESDPAWPSLPGKPRKSSVDDR